MANQRKAYLIDPKFQIKFSLYLCIALCVATSIYPLTIYDLMGKTIGYAAQITPAKSEALNASKGQLINILIMWQVGFTALIFILGIYFSHKVAGPIYKLRKYFSHIKEGNHPGKMSFRKGDYFKELATDFNETIEAMHENHKNDFVYLSEVNTYINNLNLVVPEDKKIVLAEISKRLFEIQERYKG